MINRGHDIIDVSDVSGTCDVMCKNCNLADNAMVAVDCPNPQPEMVTITVEEYNRLLDAELFLNCLEMEGVDNWDGYDYARARISNNED